MSSPPEWGIGEAGISILPVGPGTSVDEDVQLLLLATAAARAITVTAIKVPNPDIPLLSTVIF